MIVLKIIFLDVDGTLVGEKDGVIYTPDSAIEAIVKARQICTGRSLGEIGPLQNIGFDGIIGAAGGFLMENGQFVFQHRMPEDIIHTIIQDSQERDLLINLECDDGWYCNQAFIDYTAPMLEGQDDYASLIHPIKDANLTTINKVTVLSHSLPFEEICQPYEQDYTTVAMSWPGRIHGGEISLPGISKATAIQYVLASHQYDKEDTMAIGDSMNDIEMFKCVNTAIAMGNYRDKLDKYASYITDTLDNDGLYKAFAHFKLI